MFTIGLTAVSVTSLQTLGLQIVNIIEKANIEESLKSEEFTTLKDSLEDYAESILKKGASDYSSEVIRLDSKRDKLIVGLRNNLASWLHCDEDDEERLAADALKIFEQVGNRIERLPYDDESARLNKLISELGKNTEIVKKLSLQKWLDKLTAAQKEFEEIYTSRRFDENKMGKIPSATSKKKDLINNIFEVADYVSSMARVNKTQNWKDLKEIIESTIEKAAKQKSKTKTDDSEEPEQNQES